MDIFKKYDFAAQSLDQPRGLDQPVCVGFIGTAKPRNNTASPFRRDLAIDSGSAQSSSSLVSSNSWTCEFGAMVEIACL